MYYSPSSALDIFRKVCAAKRRYYWSGKEEPRFTLHDIIDVKCSGKWKVIVKTKETEYDFTTKEVNFRECEEIIKFLEIKTKEQVMNW